jgi:putative oxidoreductase
MNALLGIGRYLFFLPFIGFGLNHMTQANMMAGMVPDFFPGGALWVYVTGLAQLAAVVSGLMGKYDKLAFTLLGIMLIIFALSIHLRAMMGGDAMAITGLLKDLGLAGASFMYASHFAKDRAVIG